MILNGRREIFGEKLYQRPLFMSSTTQIDLGKACQSQQRSALLFYTFNSSKLPLKKKKIHH
jgi:hypothetical protein